MLGPVLYLNKYIIKKTVINLKMFSNFTNYNMYVEVSIGTVKGQRKNIDFCWDGFLEQLLEKEV